MEREILEPMTIAHPDGRLRREAVGWARHPIHDCRLAPGLARVERFNYWCITSRAGALTLLFADVGFFGVVMVSFLDLAARKPIERIHLRPGGLAFAMPDTPGGDLVLNTRRLHLALRGQGERMQIAGDVRTLLGKRLTIDLTIARPMAHETVNVLVPWDDTRFHFTSKQQALPARGVVCVGSREYRFGPDNDGFGCLDFGRGRWPRGIDWRWAFGAATCGGHTLGLNLGGTWTDALGVTENGVVIDGRVHKIADAVQFDFDPRAYMTPWRIRTCQGARLDLRFDPISERAVKVPLGIVSAELHQMMGIYSGTFVADDGEPVAITNMLGLAESFRGRW